MYLIVGKGMKKFLYLCCKLSNYSQKNTDNMNSKHYLAACGLLLALLPACKEVPEPAACGPCPTEDQITWQEMERTAFIHFSMNTFNDVEWGYGDVPPETFNPTNLDCNQWVSVCKQAGIKGIILTAKHHDGFCLWPTATTEYSVKHSPWRDGKGDLVRELSDACHKQGLKFGIYLSPWDRNAACYGTPEYIDMFRAQLTELLTNYGDIFEVWFDGANGGTGYYGGAREDRSVDRKNYYDWPNTIALVRKLQPHAMIFGDGGPDVRWCGNEEGWVGETNWSTLRRDEVYPGWPLYEQLRYGHEDGTHWVPAEVNVSTRPGWFYHASEDHKVKTLPQLLDIYYHSIGRNGLSLINFPIDKRGLIHPNDSAAMVRLQQAIEADFAVNVAENAKVEASNVRGNSRKFKAANVTDNDKNSYWATDDGVTQAVLTITLDKPTEINRFVVEEYIRLGQRVMGFVVEAMVDGQWKILDTQSTIGYRRILRLPTVTTDKVRFTITDAKECPLISRIALYHAPKVLTAPLVQRNIEGLVTVTAADPEAELHYTVDGSTPTAQSPTYKQPVMVDQPTHFQVIAYDPESQQRSPVTTEQFDVVHTNWKVVGVPDEKAQAVFDGDPKTVWYQKGKQMPQDLVIDLASEQSISGFRYLPDQNRWAAGIIFNYEFAVSKDGKSWQKVSEGEFSNIKNNPLWQSRTFEPVSGRYIKLRALSNTEGDTQAGYAEVDIITTKQ